MSNLKIQNAHVRVDQMMLLDHAAKKPSVEQAAAYLRQAFAKSPAWNGRGGTDLEPGFALIPKYKPEVVVCLTDGYLSWPDQKDAHGLPVMFLMVNATQVPPWGQRLVME